MSKVIGWILSFTKLGKVVEPVQKFLSGKKVYLGAAGVAIPALLTIISNFGDQGMSYLVGVAQTTEWKLLMEAIMAAGLRAAVTKAADPKKDPNVAA